MKNLTIYTEDDVRSMFNTFPTMVVVAKPEDENGTIKYSARVLKQHRGQYIGMEKFFIDVSASMIEYISKLETVRLCNTAPGPTFDRFRFYCLRDLFMENDLSLNQGFPEGMVRKNLVPGAVVETCWSDGPLTKGIVTEVDSHAHNYKGERGFKMLDSCGSILRCTQTQIVQMLDDNGMQTLHEAIQKPKLSHEVALLHIQQLAQGSTDDVMQEISETADQALVDNTTIKTITKQQLIQAVSVLRGDGSTEYNRALAEVCAWLMPECKSDDNDDPVVLLDSLV
jgi:hypothetical protein